MNSEILQMYSSVYIELLKAKRDADLQTEIQGRVPSAPPSGLGVSLYSKSKELKS